MVTRHIPSASAQASPKPRKADAAYDRLRDLIITLALEPGSPLDERELMAQIGVGRTPLREAIQRLTHEGLVMQQPRRGAWVSPLSITDLQHLIEARRLVEPPICRLAAARITAEHVERIAVDLDEAEALIAAGDNASCVYLDQRFHLAIAGSTGNRHMVRMVEQIHHEMARYWYVSFVRVGNLGPTFVHHHLLLDAIARRAGDEAERMMHEHIDLFRDRVRNLAGGPDGLESGSAPSSADGRERRS